ncbi:MAG: cell wall hydrolase, partial [Devosia sp.]
IDGAAASPGMSFTTAAIDVVPTEDTSTTVTDDMLARYAHHGFVPTDRRVAHANDEKLCLSRAIYHEARGEVDTGQWAVANVIINRALSKRFPTSMCGVVYQNADQGRYRCQFTFACDGQQEVIRERQAWAKAGKIAAAAYSEFQHGQRPGVVPGSALYYHTTSVSTNWGFKQVAQIGSHLFYSPM